MARSKLGAGIDVVQVEQVACLLLGAHGDLLLSVVGDQDFVTLASSWRTGFCHFD